jgi:uncharacterized protein YndB with AHSA1/START domain
MRRSSSTVNEEARKAHQKMDFLQGWGQALDQLVALAKD